MLLKTVNVIGAFREWMSLEVAPQGRCPALCSFNMLLSVFQ